MIPKPLSPGEEGLDLALRLNKIAFQRQVKLVAGKKWAWDFVVGDLAIEIQGQIWRKGGHNTGNGLLRDYRKANAAARMGYRTMFFATEQVDSGEAIQDVLAALR